ncbi:hypothetical protein [Geodermatophilus sabuli]|uniref:Uncharacterized protein n=1 Tax=Geodermatophilus sabuli TaxID=1564158 RepID=A0A285EK92_9ACTN|nr:hypothetical protein [Geodermatophilus sabuli]MBB3086924.1 hypothetical protein [Geodermatophilus sabuli]SNX99417.1 hypothetical protein SAMN06893097_1224 [Geodermatophilus sabuli]
MWAWILGGLTVWLLVAALMGVVIGRGIRLAGGRAPGSGAELARPTAQRAGELRTGAVRARRRSIPLPPVGVGLAAVAVALEAVGYAGRLAGATGPTARALSMDAPYSVPRMFVAALFATAAVAAVAGAARIPRRRAWWLAVGLVAAAIASIKAGSTVHYLAMERLGSAISDSGAVVVSVLGVGAVLAVLAFISRAERRDRRRVLSCLAAYGGAAVGLSAVSAAVDGRWAIAATFVEESGEALAGVAFLVAVLVGVAPRLVLPASWVLRRQADAHTLEVSERRSGARGTARG